MAHVAREPERITPEEVKALMDRGEPLTIVDVRSPASYAGSEFKIKGAIRIPSDDIVERLNEIPRDKKVVTYCT